METAIPVAVTAAVVVPVIIGPVRNAEHAFDGADRTTDAGADRTSNHTADRPADPITFMSAFMGATDDALGMSRMRQRKPRECQDEKRNSRQKIRESLRRPVVEHGRLGLHRKHLES